MLHTFSPAEASSSTRSSYHLRPIKLSELKAISEAAEKLSAKKRFIQYTEWAITTLELSVEPVAEGFRITPKPIDDPGLTRPSLCSLNF